MVYQGRCGKVGPLSTSTHINIVDRAERRSPCQLRLKRVTTHRTASYKILPHGKHRGCAAISEFLRDSKGGYQLIFVVVRKWQKEQRIRRFQFANLLFQEANVSFVNKTHSGKTCEF